MMTSFLKNREYGRQILPSLIVVEGQMDVIMAHQAGTKNSVALSGSSLNNEQVHLMRRYTDNIILAFDGDEAGRKATMRAIEVLKSHMNKKVSRPFIITDWDMQKWDEYCDYTDEIRWEIEADREKNRPRNQHDLANHFLGFPGSKKMLDEMIKERKGDIDQMVIEKRNASAWQEMSLKNHIETKQKEIKDLTYLKNFINPNKAKEKPGVLTEEKKQMARQVPITNFIEFNRSGFANCIFHNEKTPSMKLYKDRNMAHCFGGCGSKDVIDVVMHMFGCDFKGAVQKLIS